MFKTLSFQCRARRLDPWSGAKNPHAVQRVKKKKMVSRQGADQRLLFLWVARGPCSGIQCQHNWRGGTVDAEDRGSAARLSGCDSDSDPSRESLNTLFKLQNLRPFIYKMETTIAHISKGSYGCEMS